MVYFPEKNILNQTKAWKQILWTLESGSDILADSSRLTQYLLRFAVLNWVKLVYLVSQSSQVDA